MDCSDPEPLTRASVYASLSDPDNVFHFSDLLEAVSKRPELNAELADVLNIFAYGSFGDYAGPWGPKRLGVDQRSTVAWFDRCRSEKGHTTTDR